MLNFDTVFFMDTVAKGGIWGVIRNQQIQALAFRPARADGPGLAAGKPSPRAACGTASPVPSRLDSAGSVGTPVAAPQASRGDAQPAGRPPAWAGPRSGARIGWDGRGDRRRSDRVPGRPDHEASRGHAAA